MARVSLDLNEIKNKAVHQINELAKKAQKDLSAKEVSRQLNKILLAAKNAKVEDIINNPKVQKLINNPRVQEFWKNEKVQELLNKPKIKEMRDRISAKVKDISSTPAPKARSKKTTTAKKEAAEE